MTEAKSYDALTGYSSERSRFAIARSLPANVSMRRPANARRSTPSMQASASTSSLIYPRIMSVNL